MMFLFLLATFQLDHVQLLSEEKLLIGHFVE